MDETIFTEHVRCRLEGAEPPPGILEHLRSVVVNDLRKKGLWSAPPKYLGYDGSAWSDGEAIEDLVQDCYVTCILRNLANLAERLPYSHSIDGMVRKKVGWFISDLRRSNSGVSGRIFVNVRAASEALVIDGVAHCLDDPIVGGSLVLHSAESGYVERDRLSQLFASDLETASLLKSCHRICEESKLDLKRRIAASFATGLPGFRVNDFVAILEKAATTHSSARDAASAPAAVSETDSEGFRIQTRIIFSDTRYEDLEQVERWLALLAEEINASQRRPKVKERLHRVLSYLGQSVRNGEPPETTAQASMSRTLGIAKSTLHEDFQFLQMLAKQLEKTGFR